MNELSSWLTATQFNVENKTNIDIAVPLTRSRRSR